jgi:quercetin dioxygenase-like cupin family protein
MKVVRRTDTPEMAANNPIFEGEVRTRELVGGSEVPVRVLLVRFLDGARNVLHTHTTDQLLYVTEGHGLVGTRVAVEMIEAGDIAQIPAGEAHWHGAQPGRDMAHLAIMPPGETRIVEE